MSDAAVGEDRRVPFAYTFSYEHKDPDGREIQYEDEEEIVSERARVV